MNSLRRALIGLAVLAFLLGAGSVVLILTSDHTSPRGLAAALILTAGWGFAGTGLYAWYRRPRSNIGPLLTAVGFTWFFQAFGSSNNSVVFLIGYLGSTLPYAILIQLLVTFPSGRLETRLQKLLVATAYFITVFMQAAWVLFAEPEREGCDGCPANPIQIHGHEALGEAISSAQGLIAIPLVATTIVLLYRRWRRSDADRASRPHPRPRHRRRRLPLPLHAAGPRPGGRWGRCGDDRLHRGRRRLRLHALRLPDRPAALADRPRRGNPHGAERRERKAQRRAARQGRGAARLAGADRRRRLRGAPPGRARPPRRRPATADGGRHDPAPRPRQARLRARAQRRAARRGDERALRGDRRAARAGPRHPPRRAHRPRPGGGPQRPRRPLAGAGRGARDPGRAVAAGGRVGDLLRDRRGADQRRSLRPRGQRHRARRAQQRRGRGRGGATTESAAPTPPPAPACAASATGSARSTASSRSRARPARGRPCAPASRSAVSFSACAWS